MTHAIPDSSLTPEQRIRALAVTDPTIVDAFGGAEKFEATLLKIAKLDAAFAAAGGIFFALGATPQETAERFTRIHLEQYLDGSRPSLPALVAHHLDDIGLASDSPHYAAALLASARAEVDGASVPQYHNKNHFADVTAQTAEFLKHNNRLADKGVAGAHLLTGEEMADSITAAVAHDIDHPGGKNAPAGQRPTAQNRLRLEEQSFGAVLPLLEKAGLGQDDIDDIHAMIQTTSPDGPHHILKALAAADQNGAAKDWETLDPSGSMPDLRALGERLIADPKLLARAAMLEDADLGASAFQGMASSMRMSDFLTRELNERGYGENLRGPSARQGFGDFIVGSGPASAAAQDAVGQNYTDLYAQTRPIVNKLKTLGIGVWNDGIMEGGTPFSRAEAGGLSPAQVAAALKAMRDAGFNPQISQAADKTVFRIEGDDVARLQQFRAEVIAAMDWQPAVAAEGVQLSRVAAAPLGADEVKALNNALRGEGIQPRAGARGDIDVGGDDARLIAQFLREARKAAPEAIKPPPPAARPPGRAPKI